jgi:hypothetical protein
MASTSRLFRLVEGELAKSLELFYSVVGDPLARGRGQIRLPQRFTIEVWARNDAPVALRDVRGAITPAAAARFPLTPFHLARLEPREQRQIARLDVSLNDSHGDGTTLDRLAAISVVAHAVLPDVRFQETYRTLGFSQPVAGLPAPAPTPGRARRPALEPRPAAAAEREPRPGALGAWVRLLGPVGATGKP